MHVRLIPYSDIFVSATMSMDEATMLVDSLEVAAEVMPKDVRYFVTTLRKELEAAMTRAQSLQEQRNG